MGLLDRARSLLRRSPDQEGDSDATPEDSREERPKPHRQFLRFRNQPAAKDTEKDAEVDPHLVVDPATLPPDEFSRAVPRGLQIAGSWSWRLLVIAAVVSLAAWLIVKLSVITIPIGVGILLAAGLMPVKKVLCRWGVPSLGASAICLVGGVTLVVGVLTLIVAQVVEQSGELANQTVAGITQFSEWLTRSRIGVSQDKLIEWESQGIAWLTDWASRSQALIAQYGLQAGGYVGNFLTGAAMALFALFFFLHDGRNLWTFALRFVPRAGRPRADQAGLAGWHALTEYVKATIIVAAVDAFFPLIAALIMGVPLAWALGGLIFMGAFIPIVGVVLTGAVAVFVTLVTLGPIHALVMLGIIILVNQLEGNILQPMLLGRAVSLHPLAVLLSIAVGISVANIIGGLMVVPILAFSKAFADVLDEDVPTPPHGVSDPDDPDGPDDLARVDSDRVDAATDEKDGGDPD